MRVKEGALTDAAIFDLYTGQAARSRFDFEGDGKTDPAEFRPSTSTWNVQRSTAGTLIQTFGTTGHLPVPGAFVR